MKRFIHTITETAAVLYCVAVILAVYVIGAVVMYGAPSREWYVVLLAIVPAVPVFDGIVTAAISIAKAVHRAKKPVRYGVIPSHVIVEILNKGV